MSCITKFSKYFIFSFNLIIAICSLVFIVFGIFYIFNEKNGVYLYSSWFSLGAFAVAIGVIILFVASFGCCGAINENVCLLTTYAIILIILFVLQVVLGTLAVIKISSKEDFNHEIHDLVQDLFNRSDTASKDAFYDMQIYFTCCGVDSYNDYGNPGTKGYPKSCCKNQAYPCFQPFEAGCASTFASAIEDKIEIIGYVAIGFAVFELVGAMFAFIIRKKRKDDTYFYY